MIERDLKQLIWRVRDLPKGLKRALPEDTHRVARGVYNSLVIAGHERPVEETVRRVKRIM